MTSTRELVKRGLAKAGIDVHRRELGHDAQRVRTFERLGVTVVLDVGANAGQYVQWLRDFGYTGRVVSFEPHPVVFAALTDRFAGETSWSGVATALGDAQGSLALHVTGDSKCSSPLAPTGIADYLPAAGAELGLIDVPVTTLDAVWSQHVRPDDVVALKLDVQGFEGAVLRGALASLPRVSCLEVEMALLPLYEGGSSIYELLPRMHAQGFSVTSIGRGYVDAGSGQLLDVDVLLERRTDRTALLRTGEPKRSLRGCTRGAASLGPSSEAMGAHE